MMDTPGTWQLLSKRIMAGASVLLALGLVIDQFRLPTLFAKKGTPVNCEEVVQVSATLSQKQLAQLLTVSEGDQKQRIRDIVKEPYCRLANLQIRVGATAQREAYPLEFDSNTWLVLLYEGEQYTGYRFANR
jgi:hypothetical protein